MRRRNVPPPVYDENMRIALNKWGASKDRKRKYNRRVTTTKSQVKPQVPKRKSLPQAIMPSNARSNAVRANIHHSSLRESKYAGCNIF